MNSSKTLRDKDPLFDVVNPHSFTHRFNALLLHSGFRTRTDARDNPIVLFVELGGHVAANGLDSVYYQVADFGQLERLIGFVHEIGCPELAIHLKRGRDIYYQGRTDLVTRDAAHAAGLDGNHLSRKDDLEIAKLGDRMLGPDGLLAASDQLFMRYIKAHPELVEVILDKRTRQKLRPRLKSRKALLGRKYHGIPRSDPLELPEIERVEHPAATRPGSDHMQRIVDRAARQVLRNHNIHCMLILLSRQWNNQKMAENGRLKQPLRIGGAESRFERHCGQRGIKLGHGMGGQPTFNCACTDRLEPRKRQHMMWVMTQKRRHQRGRVKTGRTLWAALHRRLGVRSPLSPGSAGRAVAQ